MFGLQLDLGIKRIIISILLVIFNCMFAQQRPTYKPPSYSFLFKDSPSQLFTMRQFNLNYLSSYRLFARGLNSIIKNKYVSDMIQLGMHSLFFMPLTHEEGHRSILTVNHIGSISQPFFNQHGMAYVNGVTDRSLKDLRDNSFPDYIRLHTGGLESDYMLTRRVETIGNFNTDDFNHYKWEYWSRKAVIVQYLALGLFEFEVRIKEESNELERDIVGVDTYGAVRHLYRPKMEFYRYTLYKDLTAAEKDFVKRMGYRSFLNLLNPLILGIRGIQVNKNITMNMGLGYMLSPFGDFIDENIWFKTGRFNLLFTLRQFQNKENWFQGIGISLIDFPLPKKLILTLKGHYWQQPLHFDFNTSEFFSGGALDANLGYYFYNGQDSWLSGIAVDIGLIYKTKGFLPEELYLDEHFGLRFGTTIELE